MPQILTRVTPASVVARAARRGRADGPVGERHRQPRGARRRGRTSTATHVARARAAEHRRRRRPSSARPSAVEPRQHVAGAQRRPSAAGRARLRRRSTDDAVGGAAAPCDAEVGALDAARRLELRDRPPWRCRSGRRSRCRRCPAAAAGRDLRVDADHAAGRVDQRAAGVAGVDRRVGLDDVLDREAVGRGDAALQGGDDAGGQRAVEAERVADRDRRVADLRRPSSRRARAAGGRGPSGSTCSSARSVSSSLPTISRLAVVVVGERDADLGRGSTTWALVRMWPSLVDHEARAGGLASRCASP